MEQMAIYLLYVRVLVWDTKVKVVRGKGKKINSSRNIYTKWLELHKERYTTPPFENICIDFIPHCVNNNPTTTCQVH